MRRASYLMVMSVVIGGCSFSYHCGGSKVDNADVDNHVKEAYVAQGFDVKSSHCDVAGLTPATGKTFTCTVDLGAPQPYAVTATISTVDDATFHYDLAFSDGARVNGKKVEAAVAKQGADQHPGSTADCGEPAPLVSPAGTVDCKVTSPSDGFAGTVEVSFDAARDNITGMTLKASP